jgi:hypothetical protein
MSKEDMDKVIARAKNDPDFARGLARDFSTVVKFAHLDLEPNEIETARQTLKDVLTSTPPPASQPDFAGQPQVSGDWKFQEDLMKETIRERMRIGLKRMEQLSEYTSNLFRDTLDTARNAYKRIVWMNTVMFVTGISLFIFAALYAALSQQQKIYSLVFGGLGVANFVALFISDPINKTQAALSNLVQVEIAFMNFFEQITIWDAFAGQPPLNPANIEKASATLQERSREVIEMLEKYIEEPPRKKGKTPRKNAEVKA